MTFTWKRHPKTALFQLSAYADDGVIEALHEQHPWAIALQWHPEMAIDDPLQQRIFQSLVETASTRNNSNKSRCTPIYQLIASAN